MGKTCLCCVTWKCPGTFAKRWYPPSLLPGLTFCRYCLNKEKTERKKAICSKILSSRVVFSIPLCRNASFSVSLRKIQRVSLLTLLFANYKFAQSNCPPVAFPPLGTMGRTDTFGCYSRSGPRLQALKGGYSPAWSSKALARPHQLHPRGNGAPALG